MPITGLALIEAVREEEQTPSVRLRPGGELRGRRGRKSGQGQSGTDYRCFHKILPGGRTLNALLFFGYERAGSGDGIGRRSLRAAEAVALQ